MKKRTLHPFWVGGEFWFKRMEGFSASGSLNPRFGSSINNVNFENDFCTYSCNIICYCSTLFSCLINLHVTNVQICPFTYNSITPKSTCIHRIHTIMKIARDTHSRSQIDFTSIYLQIDIFFFC